MATIYDVPVLTSDDIRALAEFLSSRCGQSEAKFHRLFETHPALLGVLGYVRFLSEYAIPKRDSVGGLSRFRDRPDIIGARPVMFSPQKLYVDIIELKATDERISQKNNSQRLSTTASGALTQLFTYEHDLVRNESFARELKSIGLEIARPRKVLIFGRDAEFARRPYDYELIRAQFNERGVVHYTADELLRLAEAVRDQQIGRIIVSLAPPEHLDLLVAGADKWKISIRGTEIVAQTLSATEGEQDLYIWMKRNPGMIFVPKGYLAEVRRGKVMCCPRCRSEDIDSRTFYDHNGHIIGDEADPCIVCNNCGAVDIAVAFKDP